MVWIRGPQPDAGTVFEPQTTPLGLSVGDLQPLPAPETLDPFVIHLPSLLAQQGRDAPIPVAAVLSGQFDNRPGQGGFVVPHRHPPSLRGSRLPQDTAGTALRHPQLLLDMPHTAPPSLGAQKFPLQASSRICLSSDRSAIRFFSR